MGYRSRRRLDLVILAVLCLALGGIAAVAAAVGDSERIDGYWVSAVVIDGRAEIVEVIDYDFGTGQRHGIFRDVDDLEPGAAIEVSSSSAPDEFVLLPILERTTRIRVGDPDRTIGGRHRYRIEFPLRLAGPNSPLGWNAIGDRWEVGIDDVEIHLIGANTYTDLLCSTGAAGTWGGCNLTQPEPGHLVVTIDGLDSGEGVTISATPAAALPSLPEVPIPPTGAPSDPGTGILIPFAASAAVSLVAALVASRLVRRRGQEQVWAGGSADAAYGPQLGQDFPTRLVDHAELSLLASTEFAPPKGLSAWQGGVLHREGSSKDQQVAWLLERAIDGQIRIDGSGERGREGDDDAEDELTLVRLATDATVEDRALLDKLFGGRQVITLDGYDKQFAAGWTEVGHHLDRWMDNSRFWDPAGDQRRQRSLATGAIAVVLGALAVIVGAIMASRAGPVWLIALLAGAAAAGSGVALLTRSWELRVRTPEGSGLWILTESFRRFIEGSEAIHVERAAEQGRLREYTAWATALGHADHWPDAVQDADVDRSVQTSGLALAALAPRLGSATSSASTAPSSSGSGGGSVGGGAGGGGGGSW